MGNKLATGLFYPADTFEGKRNNYVYIDATVDTVQMWVEVLVWINLLLVFAAEFLALVDGAALGGTDFMHNNVTFRALPHTVFLVSNTAALAYCIHAIGFNAKVSVEKMSTKLIIAFVFILISITINLIHWVALLLELLQQTSLFYVNGFAFLLALTIAVGVFVLWQAWIAVRIWVLRATLNNASALGWYPGIVADEFPEPAGEKTPLLEQSEARINMRATPLNSIGTFHAAGTPVGQAKIARRAGHQD